MAETKTILVTPPTTPTKAASSPPTSAKQRMSLSSPELLKELQQPHTLNHVSVHKRKGLNIVFHGRGRRSEEAESQSKLP